MQLVPLRSARLLNATLSPGAATVFKSAHASKALRLAEIVAVQMATRVPLLEITRIISNPLKLYAVQLVGDAGTVERAPRLGWPHLLILLPISRRLLHNRQNSPCMRRLIMGSLPCYCRVLLSNRLRWDLPRGGHRFDVFVKQSANTTR